MENDLTSVSPSPREAILRMTRDLLGRDDVAPGDNFFDCGGNSLKAARLLWHIKSEFGVEISMREFFDQPTAADLAVLVDRSVPHDSTVKEGAR